VSAVRLEGVSVRYDGRVALRDVDLTVEDGSWVALVGPNGAGKTSALRAIAGLVPSTGSISIDGRAARELAARERARLVALVPQEPLMPAGMTVAHYVLLGRAPHLGYLGREGVTDRRIVAEILARLGLDVLADRPLDRLSGGERRKVSIARALAQRAPVLLLDEPTTSLDLGGQQEVLELVDDLRRDDRHTVVTAIHDLTLAAQYADFAALLVGGELVDRGTPAAILTEESIARHYGARVRVLDTPGPAVVPLRRTNGERAR